MRFLPQAAVPVLDYLNGCVEGDKQCRQELWGAGGGASLDKPLTNKAFSLCNSIKFGKQTFIPAMCPLAKRTGAVLFSGLICYDACFVTCLVIGK